MTNHDFITLTTGDGSPMDCYVAIPDGNGRFPAIILLQEAFGVNNHIRNIAERLCKEGYAVIAPDLFHRIERRLQVSYTDFEKVRPLFQKLNYEGFIADVKACYEWAQGQSFITDKVGSIGFCMGGRVSFLANLHLPLSAAVSYYGSGIDALVPEAHKLHAPHLFFWGGLDKHIRQANIDKVNEGMKNAGKEYTSVVISFADHGFNCDERPVYNALAANEAWAHTLAFFGSRLKI